MMEIIKYSEVSNILQTSFGTTAKVIIRGKFVTLYANTGEKD